MKIKNISVKPICIGDVSLLPGETAQVETVYADAVAFYISMGYFYQEGIFRSGDLNYNKFNLRSNISTEIAKGIKFELGDERYLRRTQHALHQLTRHHP